MGGRRGRLIIMTDRQQAVLLIDEAYTAGARQHKACEVLDITQRTYQRWSHPDGCVDKRLEAIHVPANKLTFVEIQSILDIVNTNEYAHLPPCQIVPRLADKGLYLASESTFYRILRDAKQLQHRQRSRVKSHRKPRELIAIAPNQVWSWDITYLPTTVTGLFYYLYLVMDVFSRKIVGWSIHENESSEYASFLVKDICMNEDINKDQVTLHSDNGAPMKGATLLATLQQLGVSTSFSRPSVSNDNPYSESLFKTLKYCYFYPDEPFESIIAARSWVEHFTQWYNTEHYHSALKFMTPEQRHKGDSGFIVAQRQLVYAGAKERHPERWSGDIRNWELPIEVVLNPTNNHRLSKHILEVAIMNS